MLKTLKAACALKTLTAAAALLAFVAPAQAALQFQYLAPQGRAPAGVGLTGDIEPGDSDRLLAFVNGLPQTTPEIVYISLSSPGGNFLEGIKLADLIHHNGMWTYVGQGNVCASACFYVFAAGSHRALSATAKIGVHRSSEANGTEDANTKAASVAGADILAKYGIPTSAIGKLIVTPAVGGSWLTAADLANADPQIRIEDAPATASATPPASAPSAPTSAPTATATLPAPAAAAVTPAQQAGFEDGRRIHALIEALPDDRRHGAYYWADVRSVPDKAAQGCQPFAGLADYLSGCELAKQQFTPADYRRTHEPDYKLGWNQFWSTVP
jgi:hypothetical protein